MTKEIHLTHSMAALVDDEDYEFLMQWKWHAHKQGRTWYALRNEGIYPFRKTVRMHRVVLKTDAYIDHVDECGLNNQKENLRPASKTENGRNVSKKKSNTSGYKGVTFDSKTKKWRARIRNNGDMISLGFFLDKIEAARAYDRAARVYHGEFANTNFGE